MLRIRPGQKSSALHFSATFFVRNAAHGVTAASKFSTTSSQTHIFKSKSVSDFAIRTVKAAAIVARYYFAQICKKLWRKWPMNNKVKDEGVKKLKDSKKARNKDVVEA